MSHYNQDSVHTGQHGSTPTNSPASQERPPLHETALATLRSRIRGSVIVSGDSQYDQARLVWNGRFDQYPAVIVGCHDADDVKVAINFAREQSLEISVRSGGHSISAYGSNDHGIIIDVSSMKAITVDPVTRTARLEPGLKWAEVAAALEPHGLALTSGDTGSVGVGGLLTGGGIGWMVRKYGLTIDHVRSIELVTADGELLHVSADKHPELFWGLRGGGGNFGVVTAFEVDLHPGGTILGGMILFEIDDAEKMMLEYTRIASAAPDELTTYVNIMAAPPLPFIPAEKYGKPMLMLIACYTGDISEGERVVAPLRGLGPIMADMLAPMPYSGIFSFTSIAEERAPTHAVYTMLLSNSISRAFIHTLLQECMSPDTMIHFRVIGGAMNRIAHDATAFAHRNAQAMLFVAPAPPAFANPEAMQVMHERVNTALAPYTDGSYANFANDTRQEGMHVIYPPATYARLAALKRQYDPNNIFHLNQNILPAAE